MKAEQWEALGSDVQEARIRAGSSAVRALRELRKLRDGILAAIDAELIKARESGVTWETIGPTRQAAQQLYTAAKKRQSKSDE